MSVTCRTHGLAANPVPAIANPRPVALLLLKASAIEDHRPNSAACCGGQCELPAGGMMSHTTMPASTPRANTMLPLLAGSRPGRTAEAAADAPRRLRRV